MNPVFEDMILLAFALLVFGQIVVPLIRERPLFPLFRPKWDTDRRLKDARLKHAQAEAKLEVAKIGAATTQIQLETATIEAQTEANKASPASEKESAQ